MISVCPKELEIILVLSRFLRISLFVLHSFPFIHSFVLQVHFSKSEDVSIFLRRLLHASLPAPATFLARLSRFRRMPKRVSRVLSSIRCTKNPVATFLQIARGARALGNQDAHVRWQATTPSPVLPVDSTSTIPQWPPLLLVGICGAPSPPHAHPRAGCVEAFSVRPDSSSPSMHRCSICHVFGSLCTPSD